MNILFLMVVRAGVSADMPPPYFRVTVRVKVNIRVRLKVRIRVSANKHSSPISEGVGHIRGGGHILFSGYGPGGVAFPREAISAVTPA